jgi:hypothetical protein
MLTRFKEGVHVVPCDRESPTMDIRNVSHQRHVARVREHTYTGASDLSWRRQSIPTRASVSPESPQPIWRFEVLRGRAAGRLGELSASACV